MEFPILQMALHLHQGQLFLGIPPFGTTYRMPWKVVRMMVGEVMCVNILQDIVL